MTRKSNSKSTFSAEEFQEFYQYALVLCQNSDDAYDLLQTGFEKYLNELNTGKVFTNHAAYLRMIIRNQFIDHYRYQQKWQVELFEEQSSHDISSLDIESLTIARGVLDYIWKQISPEDRDILYHWAVLGYSTDEACELLGLARGTFLSRLHRLRKYCQQFAETPSNNPMKKGG